MAIKEVTTFETDDGKRFDTLQEAQKHDKYGEQLKELSLFLYENTALVCGDEDSVAEIILEHYEVKRK